MREVEINSRYMNFGIAYFYHDLSPNMLPGKGENGQWEERLEMH